MIPGTKFSILVVFVVCTVSATPCASTVFALNTISEVSVSPDLRRVAIKTNGRIAEHTAAVTVHPPRLVVDIPNATLAQKPQILGLDKDSALQVRIAKTHSGAQVALDFGTAPVPDHKIREIDNYIIVLLGDWQAQPRAQVQAEPAKTFAKRPNAVRPQSDQDIICADGSELLIKSAEEVNGVIVLKVAKRTEPQRVYRIDLGVDLKHLGFNGASVHPSGGQGDEKDSAVGMTSNWAQPSAQGKQAGPRKTLTPTATASRVATSVRKPAVKPPASSLSPVPGKAGTANPRRAQFSRVQARSRVVGGVHLTNPQASKQVSHAVPVGTSERSPAIYRREHDPRPNQFLQRPIGRAEAVSNSLASPRDSQGLVGARNRL